MAWHSGAFWGPAPSSPMLGFKQGSFPALPGSVKLGCLVPAECVVLPCAEGPSSSVTSAEGLSPQLSGLRCLPLKGHYCGVE